MMDNISLSVNDVKTFLWKISSVIIRRAQVEYIQTRDKNRNLHKIPDNTMSNQEHWTNEKMRYFSSPSPFCVLVAMTLESDIKCTNLPRRHTCWFCQLAHTAV